MVTQEQLLASSGSLVVPGMADDEYQNVEVGIRGGSCRIYTVGTHWLGGTKAARG